VDGRRQLASLVRVGDLRPAFSGNIKYETTVHHNITAARTFGRAKGRVRRQNFLDSEQGICFASSNTPLLFGALNVPNGFSRTDWKPSGSLWCLSHSHSIIFFEVFVPLIRGLLFGKPTHTILPETR